MGVLESKESSSIKQHLNLLNTIHVIYLTPPPPIPSLRLGVTWSNVDSRRTLGYGDASEGDGDGVRTLLGGLVGTPEHTVSFILHHGLQRSTLRILDESRHVSNSRP